MSILNKLKLTAALKSKRNELAALTERKAELDRRYAELEEALREAESEEDVAVVQAQLDELDKADENGDKLTDKIAEVEREISELEDEIKKEETPAPVPADEGEGKPNERMMTMNRFQARKLFESGEYYERAEVIKFYDDFKALKQRGVGGEGLTIPEVTFDRITDIMGDYTTLYPLVDKIRVKGEARILIDTDTTAAEWMEMGAAIPDGDVGTIMEVSFDGFKVGKIVFVDNYILQDSIINLDDYVTRKIARAMALALDMGIIAGKGSTFKQPTGILTALSNTHRVDVTKSPKTLIDTVKQIKKVDSGEDSVGEIFAVMKRSTYYDVFFEYSVQVNSAGNVVGKLPNLANPDLLGLRVIFSNHMPADKVLFGEFDKYTLVEREGITIDRSEHYKFKDDQMSFRGKGRYDGKPVKPDAFVLVSLVDLSGVTVNAESADTDMWGTAVGDMQSNIVVTSDAITGTLKYLSSGQLVTDWGAGYFLALKFSDMDAKATSVKVGLEPSQSSGLVELDADKNGVFKITDKNAQKFVVVSSDGSNTFTQYYDLSGLVLQNA